MKTVTVEEVQSGFPELLRLVARGEELRVVRKRRSVARIIPVRPKGKVESVNWAETWSRVDAIFGGKPAPGKPGSEIIKEGRR
jgi:antitoxin (DNA-binding transcriptional repressor) of toxin-antitoxin stability system